MDSSGENLYRSNMNPIESYNLFGESGDLPDVVHCETIEVRSVLHDWELHPHRHGRLHQFLVIERGEGLGQFDGMRLRLTDRMCANVPTGVVHAWRFQPGTEGFVVTVGSELLDQGLAEGEGLRPLLKRPMALAATPEVLATFRAIFSSYEGRDFARAHVLRAQVSLLAGLIARGIAEAGTEARADSSLQRRFEQLVEAHYAEHLPVAEYASRLAVTPTHLSRVMRNATGRPASAVVGERIIREARRLLAFSNLSVSEIAYRLGYGDPAHFSRVFSRATGLSPRAFRHKIETDA